MFSAFTSKPISSLLTNKASAFFFISMDVSPRQRKPEAEVSHSVSNVEKGKRYSYHDTVTARLKILYACQIFTICCVGHMVRD